MKLLWAQPKDLLIYMNSARSGFYCDVKYQPKTDYQPKIADFKLSKILNRGRIGNPSFSQIRGTMGYMAPEWVFNLSITSKFNVYSWIVILELITRRSPTGVRNNNDNAGMEQEDWSVGCGKRSMELLVLKGDSGLRKLSTLQ